MKVIQSGWPLISDDDRYHKLVSYYHALNMEYPQWLLEYKHNPNVYYSTCVIEIDGIKIQSEKLYSVMEYENIPPNTLQEIVRRTHREVISNHIMEQLGL